MAKEKTVREEVRDLHTEMRTEIATMKRQLDRIELALSRPRVARVIDPARPAEAANGPQR
jgi:hypothetical protein